MVVGKGKARGIGAGLRQLWEDMCLQRPGHGILFLFLQHMAVLTINPELESYENLLGDARGRPKWVHHPGDCANFQRMDTRVPPVAALNCASGSFV